MTTVMAIILGAALSSAFWIIAHSEMTRTLKEVIADLAYRNAELRKQLDKLERYELTEANNPPDWWMTRTE